MTARTIVEDTRFTTDLDHFRTIYPELDDIYASLSFLLATSPWVGTALRVAPDFRLFRTRESSRTPPFWVLYRFDDTTVTLYSIEPVDIEW